VGIPQNLNTPFSTIFTCIVACGILDAGGRKGDTGLEAQALNVRDKKNITEYIFVIATHP